jgi:hypothetical protein
MALTDISNIRFMQIFFKKKGEAASFANPGNSDGMDTAMGTGNSGDPGVKICLVLGKNSDVPRS